MSRELLTAAFVGGCIGTAVPWLMIGLFSVVKGFIDWWQIRPANLTTTTDARKRAYEEALEALSNKDADGSREANDAK